MNLPRTTMDTRGAVSGGRRFAGRRRLYVVLSTLALAAAWVAVVLSAAAQGWLRQPLTDSSAPDDFMAAARESIAAERVGNLVLVLIERGEVVDSLYQSVGVPVDGDSVFQVASLSKWLTAVGVMALVEDGALDLDAPVDRYLTRWMLPESPLANDGVTARRLLSHTAGLGDGLGYAGFENRADLQTLEASLTKAADASPGANGAVRVVHEPGTAWEYSGGGYTLLQLLVEEVSGQPFAQFMNDWVFRPLGMARTTFDPDAATAAGTAENYRPDGSTEPLSYYTAAAAAAGYTTANDLVRFLRAQIAGDSAGGVLSAATLQQMREPHASELGADIWGLGVMLYAPNGRGDFVIGHDGNNEPAINTAARLDPTTGDGIVVLETGGSLLATRLAGEWVFWKTGNVDFLDFTIALERTLRLAAIGALVIGVLGAIVVWRIRPRSRAA